MRSLPLLIVVVAVLGGAWVVPARSDRVSLPLTGFRRLPVAPLVTKWPKTPPIQQLQGTWRNEQPTRPGDVTMLVVQGVRVRAFVRGAEGDSLLGDVEARTYVGTGESKSLFEVTRLAAVFPTDSAEVELAISLEKRGRIQVDEMIRRPDTSPLLDSWSRFRFSGGLEKKAMLVSTSPRLPEFPWPPPRCSVREVVPDNLATRSGVTETCGAIFDRISYAMTQAGFMAPAVYAIPGDAGFVVVSHLENIREDGWPLQDRFTDDPQPDRPRSISQWLAALTHAPRGRYRVIVLAVTTTGVVTADKEPSVEEADRWLDRGWRALPPEVREKSLPGAHCEALVYEFDKPSDDGAATQFFDDGLGALTHLSRAHLWENDLP